MRVFSAGEAIGAGWAAMKKNLGFFIVMQLIIAGVNLGPTLIADVFGTAARLHHEGIAIPLALKVFLHLLALILRLGGMVLTMIVALGSIRIYLKACDGEELAYGDLFSCVRMFFRFLGLSVLNGLIAGALLLIPVALVLGLAFALPGPAEIAIAAVVLGLVFLGVGIYVSLRLWAGVYSIVDRSLGPVQSLKKSWEITRGYEGALLSFWILAALINLAGILCCLVGTLVTAPTTAVAAAHVYRRLLAAREGAPALEPSAPGAATA